MYRIVFFWILLSTISARNSLFSISSNGSETILPYLAEQDTLKENQTLYTGRVWINNYHRINGDQFLFSNFFLPGTVSANGNTFKNLLIRYDIFSDEIMIPVSRDEILQLNKEVVDSFSIRFENQAYLFTKIIGDTLNGLKGFNGYFNVLYKQGTALYIKFKKDISPNITDKSDGEFLQNHKTYFIKKNVVYPISSLKDLYTAFGSDEVVIKNYVKKNKLKVSKNKPESLIPVIRFYDNLSH